MGVEKEAGSLAGARVLIVEDRFLLADDLRRDLIVHGASIIGPASTVDGARSLVNGSDVDLAVLDIDLRGRAVYPLAEELQDRGIPVVFASGMPKSLMPRRWAAEPFVGKPISIRRLVAAIEQALNGRAEAQEDDGVSG